jgi:hypothetical protein
MVAETAGNLRDDAALQCPSDGATQKPIWTGTGKGVIFPRDPAPFAMPQEVPTKNKAG